MEGIPEWCVLVRCMSVCVAKVRTGRDGSSYADLFNAARNSGVSPYKPDGTRKGKVVLRRQVARQLRQWRQVARQLRRQVARQLRCIPYKPGIEKASIVIEVL